MIRTRRESFFKIYPENIVIVVYNILKIFTMHFNKIDLILYFNLFYTLL